MNNYAQGDIRYRVALFLACQAILFSLFLAGGYRIFYISSRYGKISISIFFLFIFRRLQTSLLNTDQTKLGFFL